MFLKLENIKLNKIKPISVNAVKTVLDCSKIFFFEEGEKSGGCGEIYNMMLTENSFSGKYYLRAVEDKFVCHATTEILLKEYGFDDKSMAEYIQEVLSDE